MSQWPAHPRRVTRPSWDAQAISEVEISTKGRGMQQALCLSMHSCVDFAGDSSWESWYGFEFFEGGVEEGFGGAEVG